MLNAARHAGGEVSVYVESSPAAVEVFVRDRGPGFALADVPSDRLGVRQSIIGRMRRIGGSGEVRPGVRGVGTEVRLRYPPSAGDRRTAVAEASGDRTAVRVVVVDDHSIFRSGLKADLADSIEVVGEAHDVESAVQVVTDVAPDVVLLDVHLPGSTCLPARAAGPR